MPTPTYVPLATVTLTGTEADIEFSSIPATYRDLVIVFAGTSTAVSNIGWRPNGDTSNHSAVFAAGNGSTTSSGTLSAGQIGFMYTTQTNNILHVFDYAQTDKHKTFLSRSNNAGNATQMIAGRWAVSSAITSITIAPFGTTFAIGATFSLYGVN